MALLRHSEIGRISDLMMHMIVGPSQAGLKRGENCTSLKI